MIELPVEQLTALCQASAVAPLLLDVREPWEVALASLSLPGLQALHIPMGQIPGRLAELDETRPVICLCHHGMRSGQVAAFLERAGFEQVYNLSGGIDAWSARIDASVPRY